METYGDLGIAPAFTVFTAHIWKSVYLGVRDPGSGIQPTYNWDIEPYIASIYIIVYIYNLYIYISLGYSIVIVIHHLPGMYIHPSCVKSSGSDRTNTNSGSGTRTCTGGTWDGRWILLISMDWFKGQSTGKPMKTPYLLKKSMVSCKISLRSIQGWLKSIYPIIYDYLCL